MIRWQTIYSGTSSRVFRQMMTILQREEIPFRCGSAGLFIRHGKERYRIAVRAADVPLAILTLKKYRAKN
jgi:hypothetical protein